MNLSASIFLINDDVRPVRVSYDPDLPKNNNPNRLFKTLDKTVKKDDYVIVPTTTRHGFTVCRVEETDFVIDYDGSDRWDWVVGKVDKEAYDAVVAQEAQYTNRIGQAEQSRKKHELAAALKLADLDLTGLDVTKTGAQLLTNTASPRGTVAQQPEDGPVV